MLWLLRPVGASSRYEFVDDRGVTEGVLHSRFMDTKVVFDQMGQSLRLSRIRRAVDQLDRASDIELDLRGTPYEIQVWNLLREIAVGELRSARGEVGHARRDCSDQY
jgi:O6-methylguanine-DNA--protein-cysteine methyltransferase